MERKASASTETFLRLQLSGLLDLELHGVKERVVIPSVKAQQVLSAHQSFRA
jgi:hypothetical protein